MGLVRSAADGRLVMLSDALECGRGGAQRLAGSLPAMLAAAGLQLSAIGLIATIVGPGSFTGLRATLALAHGLALGSGTSLVGVTVGEALRRTAGPRSLPLWCVTTARTGRVFLERDGLEPVGCMLQALPSQGPGPLLLAGNASDLVQPVLEHSGIASRTLGIDRPELSAIAGVAIDRAAGRLPPLAAQPFYVDPPEAKLPAKGLRSAPA